VIDRRSLNKLNEVLQFTAVENNNIPAESPIERYQSESGDWMLLTNVLPIPLTTSEVNYGNVEPLPYEPQEIRASSTSREMVATNMSHEVRSASSSNVITATLATAQGTKNLGPLVLVREIKAYLISLLRTPISLLPETDVPLTIIIRGDWYSD
jgi:hypothetical protein